MEKILILGGTKFIGRCLVEELHAKNNYDLTLLNRGVSNPHLFPEIRKIAANRNTDDLSVLLNEHWDYIIDVSCYFPHSIQQVISTVSANLKKYIFISTCSVYAPQSIVKRDENALLEVCLKDYQKITSESYGKLKAKCEEHLQNSGLNYTILRPALVYGKYDNTDRLYYWLHQVKNYDKIAIPNQGQQKISLTYIEDLIQATIKALRPASDQNAYNMTSLPEVSISTLVDTAGKLLSKSPNLLNLPSAHLKANNIREWADLPLWIDDDYMTFDNKKIKEAYDLAFVDFAESINRTIQYYDALDWPIPSYGINRERQLELMDI